MEYVKLVLFGVAFGVANIIPGVSGGTIAVICKFYDRLIEAISLKNFKKNLPFLICIVGGAGVGIVAFSHLVTYLLENFVVATNFAFLGLILGSIPSIYKNVFGEEDIKKTIKASTIISFLLGIAVMVFLTVLDKNSVAISNINADNSLGSYIYLFVVGLIAMFAMLLPGISGSLVLLVLGGYEIVMTGVKGFNFSVLIPFGLGCLVAVLGASRIIAYLMKNKRQVTYSFILGLIVASLYSIFPDFSNANPLEIIIAIILFVAFTFVAFWFSKNTKEITK